MTKGKSQNSGKGRSLIDSGRRFLYSSRRMRNSKRVREGDGSVREETTDVGKQIAEDDACIRVGGSNVVLLQNMFVWNGLLLRLRMWLLKTYKKSCE